MQEEYFYVKSDADHYDLADIFGGVYLKNEKLWRFKSEQKEEVTNFLHCSSSESDEGMGPEDEDMEGVVEGERVEDMEGVVEGGERDSMIDSVDTKTPQKLGRRRKRRDRLHRANSFNASDDSNESCDSFDENYRRRRKSKSAILKERFKIEQQKLKE